MNQFEQYENRLEGYNDTIKSDRILSFSYQQQNYSLQCYVNNREEFHIKAKGGNRIERDKTGFRLDYISKNRFLLDLLQGIIEKYKISYHNGYILEVPNDPDEYISEISIEYEDGEKIYKFSNQFPTIATGAFLEIIDAFHCDALINGYDFTAKKSNVPIYDDATEEYLQGRWSGEHFNKNYLIIFKGLNVQVYCNNALTDDTSYIIIRGKVKRRKKKVEVPASENDFEAFHHILSIEKKNASTILVRFIDSKEPKLELKREVD